MTLEPTLAETIVRSVRFETTRESELTDGVSIKRRGLCRPEVLQSKILNFMPYNELDHNCPSFAKSANENENENEVLILTAKVHPLVLLSSELHQGRRRGRGG